MDSTENAIVNDVVKYERIEIPLETSSINTLPPDASNWDALQKEINLKVAETMKSFYREHSKAIYKMEQLIIDRLGPETSHNSNSEIKEIAELMRRLVNHVENMEPVFKLEVVESTLLQKPDSSMGSSGGGTKTCGSREMAESVPAIVIFSNLTFNVQTISEKDFLVAQAKKRHKPGCSSVTVKSTDT
uniref:Uncharacterized protein n=1 Tax=Drosophila melanogaster TaxID=7227 RepID=X2JBL3_DROME|nr:uncharacterized protein Dmel_CG44437 [Drosophila melanogaster]AHN59665.1 uncharacterized protein Dmel_CG44437 [Drosophila melanogaster]|eukprot:NP_001285195.1 uncharacterized protein Dmel_CG44437 [Drosophila melanogaster]